MSNAIDAKLRITAETAQAVAALRQVKKAKDDIATPTGGRIPLADLGAGAADATAKIKTTKQAVDQLKAAERAAADEARRLARERAVADKAATEAARQAAKERKSIADAEAKAQRAAANQARQLAPQLTDIVVGLSTGQSPFTVLLQQGGQLKDVFGGVGNAAKALGSIFTATRVAVGAIAAAIGTVAFEAYNGAQQSDALRKSLALTGNIAATSAGQLAQQARAIADQQHVAIGDVQEMQAGLVASGEFTSTTLDSAGRAAVALSKLTGESAADTIKSFAGMSAGVAAWAQKTNTAYNFLSVAEFKRIQALEAAGKPQEAMRIGLEALALTMEQRSVPAIGLFERAWNGVNKAISGVLESMRAVGREVTPEQRLLEAQAKLESARRAANDKPSIGVYGGPRPSGADALAAAEQEIAAAQEMLRLKNRSVAQQAAVEQKAQEDIKKETKGYQDQITQISTVAAQQQLAATLAGLDRQQGAIDLAHAKGLDSERDYDLARNRIDRARLQAQAVFLQKQIDAEAGRKVTGPEDTLGRSAAVQGLQAQLTQLRGQIAQKATEAEVITSKYALDDARDRAIEWGAVWQQAFEALRQMAQKNAADQSLLVSDPQRRAAEEARAATATAEQELTELRARLDRELDLLKGYAVQARAEAAQAAKGARRDALEAQAISLDQQRASLAAQSTLVAQAGAKAINEATRKGLFASYAAQLDELQQSIQQREAAINQRVDAGQTSQAQGEQELLDLRRQQIPELERILQLLSAQAATPAELNQVAAARNQIGAQKDLRTELEKTTRSSAISSISNALTDIETGAKSGKAALLDMVGGFAKAMLDVLNRRLAEALVDQFTQAAGSSGFFGAVAGLFGKLFAGSGGGAALGDGNDIALAFHGGGVVGSGAGTPRAIAGGAFALAPRYHGGGISGLRPRERAAVLLDGEEVLTEDDPRHINNLGGGGAGGVSVGGVSIAVSVSGAQGSDADQRGAGERLGQAMRQTAEATIATWAAKESRQGGILSRSG